MIYDNTENEYVIYYYSIKDAIDNQCNPRRTNNNNNNNNNNNSDSNQDNDDSINYDSINYDSINYDSINDNLEILIYKHEDKIRNLENYIYNMTQDIEKLKEKLQTLEGNNLNNR